MLSHYNISLLKSFTRILAAIIGLLLVVNANIVLAVIFFLILFFLAEVLGILEELF